MSDYLQGKIVRLRCKKAYPGAHTHIMIGKVEEENSRYIAIKGRTFHFQSIVQRKRSEVHAGITIVRVVPWGNIEVIHWLGEKTNWDADFDFDSAGNLILWDKNHTVIAERQERTDPE